MSKKQKIIVGVFVALAVAGVVAYLFINRGDKPATDVAPSDESGLQGKIIIPAQLTPATTDEACGSAPSVQPATGKGNNI